MQLEREQPATFSPASPEADGLLAAKSGRRPYEMRAGR